MDRSVKDDDREPCFCFSSSSSSPALDYLSFGTPTRQQSQGFDSSAQDLLSGFQFLGSSQPRRSSRRHRSSGSPAYLTGEHFSARDDAETDSHSSKIVSAVDCTIKKYADSILQVLEGMNGRLSHLESVTQVLEKSVTSLKASVDSYHNEADARLKALNSHVMEMHQAVQILRDKQDISETNAELDKLQALKAENGCEKAMKQPVISSQIVNQEQLTVGSNLMPERFSTELQVSSQQLNEISGQLQRLSVSANVNALLQQLEPMQGHTPQPIQQSHVSSRSESHSTLQPQEIVQSMPSVFEAQPQLAQSQQFIQPQQGVFQAQQQQVQGQQNLQSRQGAFEAQQQHVQTEQNLQSQQAIFQAQPQHTQTQQSVQLQQRFSQTQQQKAHIQQHAQSQEGALQAQQQHVLTERALPLQGAFQTQAHHVQTQQGIQAPQGVFQLQSKQIQQSAQSQQQNARTEQNVQSQQGVIQAQSQQAQTQQSFQSHQGVSQAQSQQAQTQQSVQLHEWPQGRPFQAPMQQSPQLSSQTAIITSHSEQAQCQVVPQQSNVQQPAVGQPSSMHLPSAQFGTVMQTLPAQQLSQVQPASNVQLKNPQNNSSTQSMGVQVMVQPPHMQQTPNAQIALHGVPPGQGSFQFTQHIESFSHAPLAQATVKHSPYSFGPPYNVSNTRSPQQHPFSGQAIPQVQHSSPYHSTPIPLQGPQRAYVSQMARPAVASATSVGALPVGQSVYNQPFSGGLLNHLSREDGIVEKVAALGFLKDDVRSVIKRLTEQGQIVDMSVVVDSLMNRRNQSQKGWQAR